MNDAKPSPGPWKNLEHFTGEKHDGHLIVDANGNGVTSVWHPRYPNPQPEVVAEQDANAALIAAAPELLAALKATKALWDKHGLGDDDAESEPVYYQLCAALAKAKGAVTT
jgi:hypothetical protein